MVKNIDQSEIDREIGRLDVIASRSNDAVRSFIDAQILTLGDRLRIDAISARWGVNNGCHDAAVAAHEWMVGGSSEAPSLAWEAYRLSPAVCVV